MLSRLSCCVVIAISLAAVTCWGQDRAEMGRLVGVGQQLEKQGQFAEAIDAFDRAAVICLQEFGPTHKFTATLAAMSGACFRQLGQYTEAERRLEKALSIYEQGTDSQLVAEGVNNLAAVKYELGKFDEALALHLKSVKLMETNLGPNDPSTAVAQANLAGVYERMGQSALAESMFIKSIKTLEENNKSIKSLKILPPGKRTYTTELANIMGNLANIYMAQGEMSRAVPLVQRALLIKEQQYGPDHFEVARTLNNLGAMYSTMGQLDKAEETLIRTQTILEKTLGANHADVARALTNLAEVQKRQKKYDKAEANYLRALKIRETSLGAQHLDVATTWEHLGSLYMAMQRYADATTASQKGLDIRRQAMGDNQIPIAVSLSMLGSISLCQGKTAEAEDYYNQTLKIRLTKFPENHPLVSEIYALLAWCYSTTGKRDAALDAFDKSRRSAKGYVAQVLSVLSESEQITFLKNQDGPRFHNALSAAVTGQNPSAVDMSASWVLNSKGVTQEVLGQRALIGRDARNPAIAKISQTLVAIRKQLASLSLVGASVDEVARRKKLEALGEQEADLARKMSLSSGRPVLQGQFVSLDTVRRNIPDDAMLVEIVRYGKNDFKDPLQETFPERYAAWIIPPAGDAKTQVVDLGPVEPVDAAIKSAREVLTQGLQEVRDSGESEAEQTVKASLGALSKLVLEPLLPALKDCQNLYLSPDGGLWIVPWSALPLPDGKYAVEKFNIRYLISGRDLIPTEGKAAQATRPILIADPNYDLSPAEIQKATQELFQRPVESGPVHATVEGQNRVGQASRLPGTISEAKAIQPKIETLSNIQAYLYSDKWALEAVFKTLHQPQILVLSTHGFFRELPADATAPTESPNPLLRCGLLLAGCNRPPDTAVEGVEDGILTGLEIVGTDLRGTDLVVLSACETGLGEVRNGEGVSGLRQAFQLAGARSVVATLWQIPDKETAQLMTEFFNQLVAGSDRSAALREAQLKIIEARREAARLEGNEPAAHPFFWAAFTVTGR